MLWLTIFAAQVNYWPSHKQEDPGWASNEETSVPREQALPAGSKVLSRSDCMQHQPCILVFRLCNMTAWRLLIRVSVSRLQVRLLCMCQALVFPLTLQELFLYLTKSFSICQAEAPFGVGWNRCRSHAATYAISMRFLS